MNRKQTDFIIVGNGIAGCVLALQLQNVGKSVVLIGHRENHSSRIAAGLFNPITGKVLTKTWMADAVFSILHTFYIQAEKTVSRHFFHPRPIYRPFLSVEEQNEWMGKSASPEWSAYIQKIYTSTAGYADVNDPLGGLLLQQSGFLDTNAFMDAVMEYLGTEDRLIDETFDHGQLSAHENGVLYKNISAEKIIFCEGTAVLKNPLFHWVPVRTLKGETITVEAILPQDTIINRGVYAVPMSLKGHFKIGATYEPRDLSATTTEKGKNELSQSFQQIFYGPFAIKDQQWGFRPTSPDRRPIIGEHPVHKNVLILNGLGTKGVSLAPFAGKVLVNFLVTGVKQSTYAAMDVNRYYSLYWKVVQKP